MLDKHQVAQLLGKTEIFAKIQPRNLEAIAAACKVVRFEERSRIVTQGDVGQELFILAEGQVSIVSEERSLGIEQPILTLGPGQSFGESSLLAETPRSATAKAVSEVVCVMLAKRSFESVLAQIPEVGLEISRYLAARLDKQCQLTGFRFVSYQDLVYEPELFGMFSDELLGRLKAVPLTLKDGVLTVALTKPNQASSIQSLREAVPGLGIEPVACALEDYEAFMAQHGPKEAGSILPEIEDSELSIKLNSGRALEAPLSSLIAHAAGHQLAHLLVQPQGEGGVCLAPTDGALKEVLALSLAEFEQLSGQLVDLFLDGSHKPQVCNTSILVGDQRAYLQISNLQTLGGSRFSLRFIDPKHALPGLKELAPTDALREALLSRLGQPGTMVVLAGPARTGRSTTAYGLLRAMMEERGLNNILCLESRPLANLPKLCQVKVEKDWSHSVEAGLAQMPDLLFVDGADRATLQSMLSVTESGTTVLATLNSGNPLQDLSRLAREDESGESGLEGLGMLIGQVLVPKLCPHCRTDYEASSAVRSQLQRSGLADVGQTLFHSPGCQKCRGSGALGRLAVLEALSFTPTLREMVVAGRPEEAIRKSALSAGLLLPYSASARVFLRQGELGATTALRYFGRTL